MDRLYSLSLYSYSVIIIGIVFIVEEMFSLRRQAETIAHRSYTDSTKQVKLLVNNADHLTTDLKVMIDADSSR